MCPYHRTSELGQLEHDGMIVILQVSVTVTANFLVHRYHLRPVARHLAQGIRMGLTQHSLICRSPWPFFTWLLFFSCTYAYSKSCRRGFRLPFSRGFASLWPRTSVEDVYPTVFEESVIRRTVDMTLSSLRIAHIPIQRKIKHPSH